MDSYEILTEINRKTIFAEEISDIEKEKAVSVFLNGTGSKEDILKYKAHMRVNPETDRMYPDYYIPPFRGTKKLRLIQGYLPKTNLLYANHYELEILRLLLMFAPDNQKVVEMTESTLQRLKHTCFGNSCTQGECLAAGISVLRFLAVIKPDEPDWIDRLLTPLGDRFLSFENRQTAVQKGIPLSYLLMAFTDIHNDKTRYLITQKKEWLSDLLTRNRITGKVSNEVLSERARYQSMGKQIVKNAIATLPGYENLNTYEI